MNEQQPLSDYMPQANDIERAVIGAMIIDRKSIENTRAVLHAKDFFKPEHALLFTAITDLYLQDIAVDALTVCDKLQSHGKLDFVGGMPYVFGLLDEAISDATVPSYCEIIIENANKRKLLNCARNLEKEIISGIHTTSEIVGKLQEKLVSLERGDASMATNLSDIIDNTHDELIKRIEKGNVTAGLPTGFIKLDKVINGWRSGKIYLIAAKTSQGKTSFALDCMKNVAKAGHPAVIFSLEMDKEEIAEGFLRNEARVETSSLAFRKVNDYEYTDLYEARKRLKENRNILIDDISGITIPKLESRIQFYIDKYKIEIVFVDYLQLIIGSASESRRIEVENISRNLKRLAKKFKMPIVALSQFSRKADESDNRRPKLSDLRDTGALEQDADVVMFLYEPSDTEKYEYNNTIKNRLDIKNYSEHNIKELIIAKQRGGKVCHILLYWQEQFTKFSNLDY